jgi:hypothetical protein
MMRFLRRSGKWIKRVGMRWHLFADPTISRSYGFTPTLTGFNYFVQNQSAPSEGLSETINFAPNLPSFNYTIEGVPPEGASVTPMDPDIAISRFYCTMQGEIPLGGVSSPMDPDIAISRFYCTMQGEIPLGGVSSPMGASISLTNFSYE